MHAILLSIALCGGAWAGKTGDPAPVAGVSPEAEISAAQGKLDIALKRLAEASKGGDPAAKAEASKKVKALKAELARLRALYKDQVDLQYASGAAGKQDAKAAKRVVKLERLGAAANASGAPDPGALSAGFDLSRRSSGLWDAPGASGGVDVGALGPGLENPLTAEATRKVLVGLSKRRLAAAQKAIPHIDHYGEELGVFNLLRAAGVREPRVFVLALMRRESAFNAMAEGDVGEKGLMQVRPETAQAFIGKKNLFVIKNNVHAGMGYLKELLVRFGRPDHALFAYNAGPTRTENTLEEHGRLPRIRDSHTYVKVIMGFYSTALGIRRPDFSQTYLARRVDPDEAPPRFSSIRRPAGK